MLAVFSCCSVCSIWRIFMTQEEAIPERHALHQYIDKQLTADTVNELSKEITECNKESGLHIQLIKDEPKAFGGFMAKYGSFRNVKNYIALVGPKGTTLDENCGYYGERIVSRPQQLGLNTCWVAMSFSRGKAGCPVGEGEKLTLVIALGY